MLFLVNTLYGSHAETTANTNQQRPNKALHPTAYSFVRRSSSLRFRRRVSLSLARRASRMKTATLKRPEGRSESGVLYLALISVFVFWPRLLLAFSCAALGAALVLCAPRACRSTPLSALCAPRSRFKVLWLRCVLRLVARLGRSGQSCGLRQSARQPRRINNGITRRCTRPLTAPFPSFVPHFGHCAFGGG